MKRTLATCLGLVILVLLSDRAVVQAQTSEEIYAGAVRRLQAEGFAGIDRALPVFEQIIQKDPNFVPGYISAADAYLLKYEFSKTRNKPWLARALLYLNKAFEKEPRNPVILFKRAVIYFNLEQPDQAVADLRQAMSLDPRYLEPRLLTIQYLLSLKKLEEARLLVADTLKIFPDDPAPMKYLADVVLTGGDNEEAARLYEGIIKKVSPAPYSHLGLSKARLNLKQYPQAIAPARKALEQDPNLVEAHFLLSVAYSETGKLNEAIGQMEVYNRKVPRDEAALNNLALLYEQSGEKTKARLAWLKLKESSADPAYQERAEQHLRQIASGTETKRETPAPPPGPPAKGVPQNAKPKP